MKLYTFLDDNEQIIVEVRAYNHSEAVAKACHEDVNWETDFYSSNI